MIIKVCGLRDPQNILELARTSINWMGFIFYEGSCRYAGRQGLEAWLFTQREALSGLRRVGVFVNAPHLEVLHKGQDLEADLIQLHGEESPAYIRTLQKSWLEAGNPPVQWIKAFGLHPDFDFARLAAYQDMVDYFIFDTGSSHQRGGTGRPFDWQLLERYTGRKPFLLSGGIDVQSAAPIAGLRHPMLMGVDINSRFETQPGHKDATSVRLFSQKLHAKTTRSI